MPVSGSRSVTHMTLSGERVSTPLFAVETLEPRTLLAGVTLITHGFSFSVGSVDDVAWENAMAKAVADRAGAGTPIFSLQIDEFENATWKRVSPSSGTANPNGDIVIELNWSAVSNSFIPGNPDTAEVAAIVAPFFTNSALTPGINYPLADLPIHLIGHSRGGSLVCALAKDLGAEGIWVDQLTTLDPHPVQLATLNSPDADARAYSNVVFADNYYQKDDFPPMPNGTKISGAYNVDLSGLFPSALLDYTPHTDVHSYYDGTIDTSAKTDGDVTNIEAAWYDYAGTGPRGSIGFNWSLIGGGSRPNSGIGQPFGGAGARVRITDASGHQWPNVGSLSLTDSTQQFEIGQTPHAHYLFQDGSANSTVKLYFDTDQNPFDNSPSYLAAAPNFSGKSGVLYPTNPTSLSTTGVPAGTYYLAARISDGSAVRYAYDRTPITLVRASQSINFPAIPAKKFGDAPFAMGATATSGLPVTYSITSGPATISNGLVKVTGEGVVTIQASQAGDATYAPANSAYQTFVVTAARISGLFFNDLTGDGVPRNTDPLMSNWRAYVDLNNDGIYQAGEPTALSSNPGGFSIGNLLGGTYIVREVRQAGWRRTQPGGIFPLGAYQITLANGGQFGTAYFGNSKTGLISGTVYSDANQNGGLDTGETGLSGWTVLVQLQNSTKTWASTMTDTSGNYSFVLAAGVSYVVRLVPRSGWKLTGPKGGLRNVAFGADPTVVANFGVHS